MEFGVDRPGSDSRDFKAARADPNLCRDQCVAETNCVAWTSDVGASVWKTNVCSAHFFTN